MNYYKFIKVFIMIISIIFPIFIGLYLRYYEVTEPIGKIRENLSFNQADQQDALEFLDSLTEFNPPIQVRPEEHGKAILGDKYVLPVEETGE